MRTGKGVYRTMQEGLQRGGKRTRWATRVLNDALCEGSPDEIALEETGDFSCRIT